MKTRLFLIAAAAVATLTSCKEKNLPFVSLEEDNYCAEAKALLPSDGMKDSLAYLAGVQNAIPAVYEFKGLDIDRCNKAINDFMSVDREAFNKAAQTNFMEEYADADKFEIDPKLLPELAQKVSSYPEEEVIPESLRDSMSYIYGVLCDFHLADFGFDTDRALKGMKDFVAIDTEGKFMEYANGRFADSTYVDYAAKFEIDPQLFNSLFQQFPAGIAVGIAAGRVRRAVRPVAPEGEYGGFRQAADQRGRRQGQLLIASAEAVPGQMHDGLAPGKVCQLFPVCSVGTDHRRKGAARLSGLAAEHVGKEDHLVAFFTAGLCCGSAQRLHASHYTGIYV